LQEAHSISATNGDEAVVVEDAERVHEVIRRMRGIPQLEMRSSFWHTKNVSEINEHAASPVDPPPTSAGAALALALTGMGAGQPPAAAPPSEVGGPKGPEPTRFGDWERNGRCIDF
jgi:hypothetical protein